MAEAAATAGSARRRAQRGRGPIRTGTRRRRRRHCRPRLELAALWWRRVSTWLTMAGAALVRGERRRGRRGRGRAGAGRSARRWIRCAAPRPSRPCRDRSSEAACRGDLDALQVRFRSEHHHRWRRRYPRRASPRVTQCLPTGEGDAFESAAAATAGARRRCNDNFGLRSDGGEGA